MAKEGLDDPDGNSPKMELLRDLECVGENGRVVLIDFVSLGIGFTTWEAEIGG